MKRNEDSLRDCWDNIKRTNICIIRVSQVEERQKGPEKIFEAIIAEKLPYGKGNSHPSPGSAESPRQDIPKEKHIETHSNQIDKN